MTAYPPIGDYAYLSDCHSAALVSSAGSIDWCCMPRLDSPSVFGRLLDWERGGCFSIDAVVDDATTAREYIDDTMVLRTTYQVGDGEATVTDCFTMRIGGRESPHRQLLRVVEGVRGQVELAAHVIPRFDYCDVRPWIRHHGPHAVAAIGGSCGLLLSSNCRLRPGRDHDVRAEFRVRAGDRFSFSMDWFAPEQLDAGGLEPPTHAENEARLEATLAWWRRWAGRVRFQGPDAPTVRRSALVLRALVNAPTGAIAAAATTSLPEALGGERNWDYRFSWIRDSTFTVGSLAEVGVDREADGFRRFIQRSAAGSGRDLQIMYGLSGERRLSEFELPQLDGYRGSRPVRIGNAAAEQLQLDAYGSLVLLTWQWVQRGRVPDHDYWRFLVDLVDVAAERWQEPDRGIWEIRGEPQHFVYSKVNCWAALDRGIALATHSGRRAPIQRWRRVVKQIRAAVEEHGYDRDRGVFTQAFGGSNLDAALLLLPMTGFLAWRDERMVRTTAAVQAELVTDGLLLRYRNEDTNDGLGGSEGTFLPCTFWLVQALARQGQSTAAREFFDRAAGTCNDLGLFAEEFDTTQHQMLGNYPQGLTHLSHIAAAVALAERIGPGAGP